MKVSPINVYHKNYVVNRKTNNAEYKNLNAGMYDTTSFKGEKGAALGVLGGFLAGAGITALTIATGGLAGIVAAAGVAGTTVAGGAACTHLGGILGHFIEEHNNK